MKEIINVLKSIVKEKPDNIAVRHTDEILSYQELDDLSDRLAYLIKESQQPIVLYGHMSPYMIVGMIGAIKAGCGYVPIDTSVPDDRTAMIIEKATPEYILDVSQGSLDFQHGKVITIEDIQNTEVSEPIESRMSPEDVVYTIFTSGSTGEPKGVQIQYSSLIEFAEWMDSLNQLGEGQEWLNQAPFSFDLSVMAIYPCLFTGGTLNLVDKDMIKKPKLLNDMLQQTPINVWVSTPSFIEMCLLLPTLEEKQYPSLKQFFFCGEILPHRTAKALTERFPSAVIYNTYGPTEATVAVTSVQITPEILEQYNPLPVGQVRPGTTLSTTDEGELVISGNSVSAGYLKNEEKTKEVFNLKGDTRTYHSGDKAKFEDQQWFIQGRIDFQIKMNGYRMELEEIETILRQSEHVKEAIVVPIYKNGKVTQLIGAVVPSETVEDNAELSHAIKTDLKSSLPEYMIPRKFVWMDQLPLTSNGKIDRKKIAEELN
ncbi:D-alanine--poly(phosphoribitol) ligase subunit 1 [Staphylococcus piscifermentans]|uniref:D-alanine--D-alanyl carrier protein ligase n=1 Tax=Staphylococcus piscifermentans TaxID=70258 RepID=A0A239UDS2_9STAP|nr:D-alanine--poly(phosphoribitol) ligase subunit DltA [Staphylococcus piscifermentans]RTX81645.1 D-alanine--poly(phosphoribitol) ligase subunit 1 [Staphylococcus piscifermentans]GEP83963.1 D-alanine--poly(phosphoribitol) ligase subunit 1 [Staphylococcus piscifermentans]SNV07254.1 D-alanine--poly(phosphoribitol) ligase subunit 1 [Staphylococcus piscifermentans]